MKDVDWERRGEKGGEGQRTDRSFNEKNND